jgi:Flp pilus assembly protein TadD
MNRIGFVLATVIALFTLTACYSSGGGGGSSAQIPALMAPADMSNKEAAAKNNEGVDHLVQGHWDVALKNFDEAIAAKANFAEAHFNRAIALDGKGDHPGATESFKKAQEFGGGNPKISENEILKKHTGM